MRRTASTIVLCLLLAGARSAARAATSAPAAAANAAAVSDKTLENGLRLIVEERPATETVALRLLLLGGALDAPADLRSLAELHASLLVRSTRDHKAAELSRIVEAAGGRLSGGASLRAETIAFDGPAESLERGVGLLGEILLAPRLDPYELEKEKGLLASSIAASRDVPGSYLMDATYEAVFAGHPFQRLVQPSVEEVRAVTIDDIRRFHGVRFAAGRLVLVVVGRCSATDVEKMARSAFGPRLSDEAREYSGGPSASTLTLPAITPPTALSADVRRSVRKRTTQAEIMIALPFAGIRDDEMPAYVLLRHILGGFQERLYAEIREKRGFAYWVALNGFAMPEAGWIGIHTGAVKKNLPAIEKVVRAELARIANDPVGDEELDRARRYMTTAEARAVETNAGRAGSISASVLDQRPFRTYEANVARLAAVTPEQIRSLARRLFDERHVAVVTLP